MDVQIEDLFAKQSKHFVLTKLIQSQYKAPLCKLCNCLLLNARTKQTLRYCSFAANTNLRFVQALFVQKLRFCTNKALLCTCIQKQSSPRKSAYFVSTKCLLCQHEVLTLLARSAYFALAKLQQNKYKALLCSCTQRFVRRFVRTCFAKALLKLC